MKKKGALFKQTFSRVASHFNKFHREAQLVYYALVLDVDYKV